MNISEELARLMECHDDMPEATKDRLWVIADEDIPLDQLSRMSWLGNHVIGELLNDWPSATSLQNKLLIRDDEIPLPVLRNAAVAALMAGDPVRSFEVEHWMTASGLVASSAAVLVRAALIGHGLRANDPEKGAAALLTALDQLESWHETSPADALVAGSLNNCVSTLIDAEAPLLSAQVVRDAVERGALASRVLWTRAGTWINQERADYLCAMAFARLGQPDRALEAAERGLSVIREHGEEDVDRAFLMLEAGHARITLGDDEAGTAQVAEASRIAASWDDVSLREWFDGKASAFRRPPTLLDGPAVAHM